MLPPQRQLLVTHGNGPQVGYILTRVEEALGKAYALPLEVCVAESEGEIGYVLQQTLHNLVGGQRPVATLLTQVLVDAADPAFEHPSKPVGPWFDPQHASALEQAGLDLVRDRIGRVRRVVPSPRPVAVAFLLSTPGRGSRAWRRWWTRIWHRRCWRSESGQVSW